MKVGLIAECANQGIEHVVCPRIAQLVERECRVSLELDIVPMTNKKLLILGGAEAAQKLLRKGCVRVVFLWDENPPWRQDQDFAENRCWHIEREALIADCVKLRLNRQRIRFVCIEREFESWLLHDQDLICSVLNIGPRFRHKARPPRRPHEVSWPKYEMDKLFRNNNRTYNASAMASSFARNLDTLERLKRCDTFRYFVQALLGTMPVGWSSYDYLPKGPRI
jgi:hypothetical protein